MYTGIVLGILALHLAAFLIFLGHWLVAAGLFPKAASGFADEYGRRPVRATLVGLFTYGPLFLLLLSANNIHSGPVKLLALIAGFGALLVAFVGTAGLALRIGRNLCANAEPWQQALRGGTMLALVFVTPLLGWAFLMHIGLASGFGVFLLSRPWKRRVAAPVNVPVPAMSDTAATSAAPALS